jgi:hypothetical protein
MGRSFFLLVLAGLLAGCPAGGDGGGPSSPPTPTASPTQTIVSGYVQAPAGQIALFKENTFGSLFGSEAYAALTGLANVPDNTIVQLARLNTNAAAFTVLSTTGTSGGRFAFNLTALDLQPANNLIVRVAGPGGKEMRAFVFGTVADITPVSEAACQLIVQALAGGPLANLTVQEIGDIHRAVESIVSTQDVSTATSVDQAVGVIKNAVAGNVKVTGFIASTGASGQTTQGAGDIGNFFPYADGNLWEYKTTSSGTGQPTQTFSNTLTVAGKTIIGSVETSVFHQSNPENDGRPQNSFALKDASGITLYGNDDGSDPVTPQVVPYQPIHFPLPFGSSYVSLSRKRVIISGVPVDFTEESRVVGTENVSVLAGSFPNAVKLERTQTFLQSGTDIPIVTGKETTWLAGNTGEIKRSLVVQGAGQTTTETEELVRAVVDGLEHLQGSQIRKIQLATKDIAYDAVRNRIYASIPGNPGQVIIIDPATGTTGPSINVGNEPNKLAISHNAQFLYVGLDGEAAIRRIDLASFTPDLLIPLGLNPIAGGCGPFIVGDIEVLPGFPHAVAVSKHHHHCTPRFAELAIYDDAVQRPDVVQRVNVTGSSVIAVISELVEFSSSSSTLYGFDGSGLQLFIFPITSQGVSLPTMTNIPIGLIVRDIKSSGNLIYTDNGYVIDPNARMVVGQFTGTPFGGAVVRPDATSNRIFFFPISAGCPAPINLLAYDQTSRQPVGSVAIQGLNCPFSLIGMSTLIRWGAHGLAGITPYEVVILNTALIP